MTYLWQDEKTGALHHELVYLEPAPFETALAWAQTHAPTRGVERIHVKHERGKGARAKAASLAGCGEARCEEGASEECRTQKDSS